jgi:hypothetical protein
MPGNREVDRAAVQFGAFNLNGSGDEDVDGEREEAETRAQPPQHSPIAPRATLPPVPAPQQPAASVPETFPTPKQSAGLPAAATHPTGKQLFKCLKNDKTDVQSAAPGLPSPAPLPSASGKLPQVPFLKLLLIINKAHLSKDLKETISASTADMDNPVPKSHHHCPKSHTTLSANRPHLPKVPSKATTTNNLSPNRNSHNLELSLPHPMSSPLITPRIPNNVKHIIAITTNSMDCRAHKASKMDLPLSSDPTADTMVPRAKDHLNSHRALPSKPNHATPLLERVKTAATPLQTRPPKANNLLLAKVLNHSLATHNSRSATTHTATPTTRAHTMLNTWTNSSNMPETILEDHTAQRVDFIKGIPAMLCLPGLLMSTLHLLQLVHSADLLCMVVIVHWVAVWVTTAVLDRLSHLKLHKALEEAVRLVVMMHSAEDLHTKDRTNTALSKATSREPVMIWSHLVTRRPPMDPAHHWLKVDDQEMQPTLLQAQPFHHHNPNRVTEATQLISNRDMAFTVAKLVANMAVSAALGVTKQLDKATKIANTEATEVSAATTMVVASNVADGAATMDTNWPRM